MICLKFNLQAELEKLKTIFLDNCYLKASFYLILGRGSQVFRLFQRLARKSAKFIRNYNGSESQIRQPITKCFFPVNPGIVYRTSRALPSINKNCVPTNQKSSVIYECECQCDSGYVGPTKQRLGNWIKQHVPSNIRNKTAPQREQPPRSCRSRNTVKTSDSAIGQHLLDNPNL